VAGFAAELLAGFAMKFLAGFAVKSGPFFKNAYFRWLGFTRNLWLVFLRNVAGFIAKYSK
jgi:hypothetical protein